MNVCMYEVFGAVLHFDSIMNHHFELPSDSHAESEKGWITHTVKSSREHPGLSC